MNALEKYEFDRLGYLILKGVLTQAEIDVLSQGVAELEVHAQKNLHLPPRQPIPGSDSAHLNSERHYYCYGGFGEGEQLVLFHLWNATPAFDLLINHARTMEYVKDTVIGPARINNSELRIRYPGNATPSHFGGPDIPDYCRYRFRDGQIDSMMVRMIYFLSDVGPDDGPFCVVPATHKSNYSSLFGYNPRPDGEPGMTGLPVRAGDAILFTENIRHGGFTVRSGKTRKTLHVGYSPVSSQQVYEKTHMMRVPEMLHITDETRARLTKEQSNLVDWD